MAPRMLLAGFHDATGHVAMASTLGQPGTAREPAQQRERVEHVLKNQPILLSASSRHLSHTVSKYNKYGRAFAEDSDSQTPWQTGDCAQRDPARCSVGPREARHPLRRLNELCVQQTWL